MSTIGKPERVTQNRVIALFRDELHYRYLGDRADRPDNTNIEEGLLGGYLPQWRQFRRLLNAAPLGHEAWSY